MPKLLVVLPHDRNGKRVLPGDFVEVSEFDMKAALDNDMTFGVPVLALPGGGKWIPKAKAQEPEQPKAVEPEQASEPEIQAPEPEQSKPEGEDLKPETQEPKAEDPKPEKKTGRGHK